MVHPRCSSAPAIVRPVVPSGTRSADTVHARRPSGAKNAHAGCAATHSSIIVSIARCRAHRASTPPSASIRFSCASSAR